MGLKRVGREQRRRKSREGPVDVGAIMKVSRAIGRRRPEPGIRTRDTITSQLLISRIRDRRIIISMSVWILLCLIRTDGQL